MRNHRVKPSRPADLRHVNARGLLRLLREHNPCSKADLVRFSGLSAPTVSSAIADLEARGLIENLGDGASRGGRPPGMLRFHAAHGYVAGVDIGGTRLRMMLADLNGKVMAQWSIQFSDKQKMPDDVCALTHDGLKEMCKEAGISAKKVLHITAGAPGITNVDSGIVISAPNLKKWHDVPLRAMLEKQTGIAASIDNDTNLAAVGEHWRGSATGIDNFVFVALGTGFGAGIFLEGRLHHGARWSAGEIGYMGIPATPRQQLLVDVTGQLERAIGGAGIEAEWLRHLQKAGITDTSLTRLRATQIFDLAEEGDRLAGEVLQYAARILANCLSDITLLLDPEVIIIGGGVGSHAALCRGTEQLLARNEFARPPVRSSSLGTQAQLHGAISISLAAVEEMLLS
ncbi:MAG TPA: ROK family protein [Edaphobacter sp.]|nr:ROK family protein [Edaphobacter sp.]